MSIKQPIILGLKVTNHDTGAALIAGGKIVAIAEERLCRVKHSRNIFPALSIDYCLGALEVKPDEVELLVIDQVRYRTQESSLQILRNQVGNRFKNAKVHVINHHDAHAAAAFFCSPFASAAVLIVDGAGESVRDHLGVLGTETETLYRGFGNKIQEIQKTTHIRGMLGFPSTIGIGKLYSFISNGYLNFGDYNEGKMMGLAPYGTDEILKKYPFTQAISILPQQVVPAFVLEEEVPKPEVEAPPTPEPEAEILSVEEPTVDEPSPSI